MIIRQVKMKMITTKLVMKTIMIKIIVVTIIRKSTKNYNSKKEIRLYCWDVNKECTIFQGGCAFGSVG